MSKIIRHILFQLFMTLAITLMGMTFVLVFGIMVKEGMRQGLGPDAIARLLPFAMPSALRFSVPASLLLAACGVYGRMSADNEVIASKSLGISPRVILLPAVMVGVAVSLGMIWLNDVAITWGAKGMQSVIAESVEDVLFRVLKTEKYFKNSHVEIHVKQVIGRTLVGPRVELKQGKGLIVAQARTASLETDLEAQVLHVHLTDYSVETFNEKNEPGFRVAHSKPTILPIPLSHATRKDRREPRVSELGLAHISKAMVEQQGTIQSLEQQLAARATLQMVLGDFSGLGTNTKQVDGQTWGRLHTQHWQSEARLNRLQLEPWRRVAEGFSCLFIVLVGAPLAIRMKTSNFFTTFAMCFFPVLCLYYPIFQWTIEQVKDGSFPPYSVWLSNGVLSLFGTWLTRRVVRY